MKVAVFGVGRMGLLHAKLLREMPEIDTLLVTDLDPQRARAVRREVDAEVVANPIVALERADAAIIATPPDTHAELAKAAVDRRRPDLCEKPLAADLRGAIDVADYVQSTGVPVQVGLQRRFDPAYAAARALVASGSLGRLHLMRLHGTEPTTPRSHRTTLFRNTAIHDFDLIRWLSGTEVESVYVEGSDREQGPFDRGLDPDTIVVTVRLCDGSLGSVTITRLSPHGYDVRAKLVGSLDHIVVGGPNAPRSGCWNRTPQSSQTPGGLGRRGSRRHIAANWRHFWLQLAVSPAWPSLSATAWSLSESPRLCTGRSSRAARSCWRDRRWH